MSKPDKLKILIVDDEESSRHILKQFLSESCHCHTAVNGKEAIDATSQAVEQQEPFDLVCLDILMPEMDGLETLRQIRQTEQSHGIAESDRCKVIMTTTASQVSKAMRAFHYGCNGYLVKPIDHNELIREINKIPFKKSLNAKWRGV